LVIAGSLEMPGAAYLCAHAAARAGAGLVKIAAPAPLVAVLGAKVVVETLASVAATSAGTIAWGARARLLELAAECDVVAMGPGLSRHPETATLIREVAVAIGKPLVLDADGLNAFAGAAERLAARSAPTVLTPHPGEMSRLLGMSVAGIQRDRRQAAAALARRCEAVVNLKGAGSVISNGNRTVVNKTGNPGMATGGTGDVLTGVIAAFLARGLGALDATILAAEVHGFAGDLAARRLGEDALLATDLLDELGAAIAARARTPG
jgi:NAD(P)H-hydrate epimerase